MAGLQVFLNYIYNQSIRTKLLSFDMPYILSKNDNYIGKVVCKKFKKKLEINKRNRLSINKEKI